MEFLDTGTKRIDLATVCEVKLNEPELWPGAGPSAKVFFVDKSTEVFAGKAERAIRAWVMTIPDVLNSPRSNPELN